MYSVFILLDQSAASDIKSKHPHFHSCGLLEQYLLSNLVLSILTGSILLHSMKSFKFIIFTTGLLQGSFFFGPFLFSLYIGLNDQVSWLLLSLICWWHTTLLFLHLPHQSLTIYQTAFLTYLPRWPPHHLKLNLVKIELIYLPAKNSPLLDLSITINTITVHSAHTAKNLVWSWHDFRGHFITLHQPLDPTDFFSITSGGYKHFWPQYLINLINTHSNYF